MYMIDFFAQKSSLRLQKPKSPALIASLLRRLGCFGANRSTLALRIVDGVLFDGLLGDWKQTA
ncbi:MAG: hypothetical protein KHY83_05880 [Coriobacteriia bacterium]|nr:hypothetical protein [Coriobacteriia bacterium]MBS5478178.1 hypothetical protein [Coriobacteriia bacterium]